MSRTEKDRPYWVRAADPTEPRRYWIPAWVDWFGVDRQGRWELRWEREWHDDWAIDSKTRWKFGRVSKTRTSRSMAKQQLRQQVWDELYWDPQ